VANGIGSGLKSAPAGIDQASASAALFLAMGSRNFNMQSMNNQLSPNLCLENAGPVEVEGQLTPMAKDHSMNAATKGELYAVSG
jgi:hypothetical protein